MAKEGKYVEERTTEKSKIEYETIANMGSGLVIAKVPANLIREQDINARIMKTTCKNS